MATRLDRGLTVGSLFSGIGGLDLGLERAGWTVIWQSEIVPYACRVLHKHWPHVPNLGNVKKIRWEDVERPDLVCGGYPCQPFSQAGRREGEDDPRHLWPYMARCLRVLRPRWALLENVAGHLSLGFDTVLADLAALGYDAEWECIPAAAFGAPHWRWRLFVVAWNAADAADAADSDRVAVRIPEVFGSRGEAPAFAGDNGKERYVADADSIGRVRGGRGGEAARRAEPENSGRDVADAERHRLEEPWGPRVAGGERQADTVADGGWWAVEPDVGRVAHGVPARVDRLKGLGNSVVPQVAEYIGRKIIEKGIGMADEFEFDPFAPGSNQKENFDGVVKCVFEKSENNDNYNAHMFIQASDGEEVESFLSLGRDWASYDGGRSVEHPRGNHVKFNNQTTYSEFVTFAMGGYDGELGNPDGKPAALDRGLGAATVMRERNRQLGNRGPQIAEIWDGLRFHFEVLKRHGRSRSVSKDNEGKEKVEWLDVIQDRMMPVRFLGVEGTQQTLPASSVGSAATLGGSSTAPTTPTSPPSTAGAPAGATHPALADLADVDRDALVRLAKTKDFGGFVDEVMALPCSNGGSMLEQPKVIQALSDESFYSALRQG